MVSNVKAPPAWLTDVEATQAVVGMDAYARRKAAWQALDATLTQLRAALAPVSRAAQTTGEAHPLPTRIVPVAAVTTSIADLPSFPCARCGARGWCGHDGRVR